jgi:hypothetical protein
MAMIRTCSAPGCRTRTLGEFCLEHEPIPATADDERTERRRARPVVTKRAQLPVALDDAGAMPRR